MDDPRKALTSIILRVPQDLAIALKEEAERRDRSRNWLIENTLRSWVKKVRTDRRRRYGADDPPEGEEADDGE